MAMLIYTAITSLDGYVVDEHGSFDWAAPDEEVHAFVNDLERPIGTYLYGRRLYAVMTYWETAHTLPDQVPVEQDFATIWQAADKLVYSTTLAAVTTARTRLEREFDPAAIRRLKAEAAADITIGGATLAARAFEAGLVDEVQLFLNPVIVGGGIRALPDHVRLPLELVDETRFASGVVYLHYRVRSSAEQPAAASRRQAVPVADLLAGFRELPPIDVDQFRADQDRYIDPAAY